MKHVSQGFTLIEVIVTIVISAIALAAVVPLLGSVFMRANEPYAQLRDGTELHSAMENLVALQLPANALDLESLHTDVGAEGSSPADGLTVVHNRYVSFAGGVESDTSATNTLLKVTLGNRLGERLSRLFAEVTR